MPPPIPPINTTRTISPRSASTPRSSVLSSRALASAVLTAAVLASSLGLAGCGASRTSVYEPLSEGSRDTVKAQKLTQEAAAIMARHPDKAERLLRDALTADLYHGPAHNNLGVLYLQQGRLYEAAGEFEWARKLMPGHPDPRMNLAMTLEAAGRGDEALANYQSALEVYPDYIPALQGLVRLQLKTGRTDERTADMLQDIALKGEDHQWREWAKVQGARHGARATE
jgi:Flp pilus assembly protein TadD